MYFIFCSGIGFGDPIWSYMILFGPVMFCLVLYCLELFSIILFDLLWSENTFMALVLPCIAPYDPLWLCPGLVVHFLSYIIFYSTIRSCLHMCDLVCTSLILNGLRERAHIT